MTPACVQVVGFPLIAWQLEPGSSGDTGEYAIVELELNI